MKNTLFLLIIFGLLIGSAGNMYAGDGDAGKSSDASSQNLVKEEKLPAKTSTGSSAFDETTTQCLKKFRSINSELVAAHQDLYRYNNPDKSNKGINLDGILNQDKDRDMITQEQITQNKKARAEEQISNLQKTAEDLKNNLIKHYNGNMPKNVSDAWKTEQEYTEYRISKIK